MMTAVILGLIISSCGINYRITTKIDRNGSCFREIHSDADSAFLAGDMKNNPFLFEVDSSWEIASVGSNTVKISKSFSSVEEIRPGLQFSENLRPIVAPSEQFKNQFRWFYTYHYFTGTYKNISDKIPVSVDKYMDKSEQKLWFQGDMSAYWGMTGFELKDELDQIDEKFMTWYYRNIFEALFDAVQCFDSLSGIENQYLPQFPEIRDLLFSKILKSNIEKPANLKITDIVEALDDYFHTGYYATLCDGKEPQIIELCGGKIKYIENMLAMIFDKNIEYELIIPGKTIYANTQLRKQDTLVWKVHALRFISDDQTIIAESRSVNIWAFAVTFLLILLAGYCFIRISQLKK
jgi:hypothetical protein